MCHSAKDGVKISKLLRQMIDTEIYKKDYKDCKWKNFYQIMFHMMNQLRR